MKRLAVVAACALVAAGALLRAAGTTQELQFPHEKHSALTGAGCESCHAGVYSGDRTQNVSVEPSLCAGCHDGQMMPAVAWQGYTYEDSGLKFRHAEHPQLGCETCHAVPAVEGAVQAARAETCLPCHGEGATEHLAVGENPCEVCHTNPKPGHTPDFATQHGTAAAAEIPQCSSCHMETFCVDCHDGPVNPQMEYHPANFVLRHSAEAWASVTECAECHSREVFCRDCHANQGLAQADRGGGYHDGVANWLQQHGVAARQNLESCVSCHQQTECLACHSAKSGWRINPHGPEFDPARAEDRSTQSCGICHTGY